VAQTLIGFFGADANIYLRVWQPQSTMRIDQIGNPDP
jgi:hypothetical protein